MGPSNGPIQCPLLPQAVPRQDLCMRELHRVMHLPLCFEVSIFFLFPSSFFLVIDCYHHCRLPQWVVISVTMDGRFLS
jgi:hypothetical protein